MLHVFKHNNTNYNTFDLYSAFLNTQRRLQSEQKKKQKKTKLV